MDMPDYKEPVKQAVRKAALGHAVAILTTSRATACCVPHTYVRAVRDLVVGRGGTRADVGRLLDEQTLQSWEALHASALGTKRPEDLAVCYLAGPEPGNDFDVLASLGVLPQNIWAFESDNATYEAALSAVRKSPFPYLKLHKGSLDQFLSNTPKKFDIVYFDACGTLPSASQKTLRTLATLFRHHRLASPGVLITNFATPDFGNGASSNHHAFLIAASLYPRAWIEDVGAEADSENVRSLAELGLAFDEPADGAGTFLEMVQSDLNAFYGQYVTRQIFDLAVTVVPWTRLIQSNYFTQLFISSDGEVFKKALRQFLGEEPAQVAGWDGNSALPDDFVLSARDEPSDHPFIWTLLKLTGKASSLPRGFKRFSDSWLEELAGLPPAKPGIARKAIECLELLRGNKFLFGDRLARALAGFAVYGKMPIFCDLPTRYLAFDSVVNQLAYPMHYVVDGVRRWRYQARSTLMNLDVIPFDECRYIYEWLPTIDLLGESLEDIAHQLCYRFALDGLGKHLHYYHHNSSFVGSTIVPHSAGGFEPKILACRKTIAP